jgi:hypothetical protein
VKEDVNKLVNHQKELEEHDMAAVQKLLLGTFAYIHD